jgi:lantibiotic transport system permease protein
MKGLIRAIQAELLKSKRTLGIWLCLLAPLTLAFLELVIAFQYGTRFYGSGTNHWRTLFEHSVMMWSLLLLPLFVTLQMGLLTALEHNNKMFKQLYILPIPRWKIYAAKAIMGIGLIALSEMVLLLSTTGVGIILRYTQPELDFTGPIPWSSFLQTILICFFSAWMMIAIQFWVSMHWSSFVLSMGVGIVGTTGGVLVISSKWAQFYPWAMAGLASMNFINMDPIGMELNCGLIGGVVVAILGGFEVLRHDTI